MCKSADTFSITTSGNKIFSDMLLCWMLTFVPGSLSTIFLLCNSNLTVHTFSLCGVEVDEDIDRAPLGIKL